ncbi:MAG: bifunctional UDP-N-acetylglucosamine diphosphorylase/glucosamine-1-phosphate N-acetyltransferase GlmU [Atopobiaceae bacterium]|jgi:bifunctional UDP-N-acetylglucosamine pyrophosphorylase/glucosamine-1-phosphate N-acetyltransferase|nr:bifunctional UDP-N-acetylglucosamine diphosphorylase/glucosamine-1-phosphate N-acetyltransferase GlmU [Atopobiaceae bacterium]MCH4119696.1 bifunctional UDP-N-acetylglucosamine diphosphorylase/glucosamine-1-phosphate N-acetyltransferase GlmU [Atopobiaceae bacterium]MCI1318808.1 bifunctional UDP-N-acetylglucosamine diphosphorylase/glucosamine-1-phosphate N-acetyltransferase GlmU [Atopobiaceae bacterium]MCI1388770.1 bifunctional UDP-N-acetylglucosamine diphosphorylase/glucosamine-1-phosphate N-a
MPVTAIILAAGEGTRMKSAHPKVTHKLLDHPLVWWSVDAARKAQVDRIVVVVGNGADEVRDVFAGDDDITFVEQAERLGTGHAVKVVRDELGGLAGPVVVLTGDSPLIRPETISKLVDHNREGHFACTVLTMVPKDPSGYGRIVFGTDGQIKAIVEDKDCTPRQRLELCECNSGIYCFCGRRLSESIDRLGHDNVQGEYYLTDMVGIYREMGEPVSSVPCCDPTELLGVNDRAQLAEATCVMRDRINQRLMAEGVSMLDPSLVWVGPDVEVARDAVLMPMTMLWGRTSVGEASVIGPNSRLTDTYVGCRSTVEETVAIEARIDDDVSCGPRAYLRPGAHLMDGSKAGTHVEIKKSTIGPGSKVPHLSYIGDATIGEGVNIGAGTITCNYDGIHKNKTTIGDRTFVGSDTMLVAPVNVGSDVTIGASSCITHDVPDGALAVERSEQKVVEGYAERKRAQRGEA